MRPSAICTRRRISSPSTGRSWAASWAKGIGTTILAGTNGYTGATTINAGTLALASSLANTAVSVATTTGNVASLQINNSVAIGTSAAAVTVGVGNNTGFGTLGFSSAESSLSTLTITQVGGTAALTLGNATSTILSAGLTFNTSTSGTDQITTAGTLVVNAGGAMINLAPTFGVLSSGGPYTLLTYGTSTNPTGLFFLGANSPASSTTYALTTSTTNVTLSIVNTTLPTPSTAYWNGSTSTVWNANIATAGASNFVTTAGGGTDSGVPGVITNVFFAGTGATNLTNTLGQGFTINSLNFTAGTGAVTIGALTQLFPLQINAAALGVNSLGNGISMASGAGSVTINSPIILGANQTWTNNSINSLTVSTLVQGSGNLTVNTTTVGPISIGTLNNTGSLTLTSSSSGPITVSTVNPGVTNFTVNGTSVSTSTITNLLVSTLNSASSGLVSIGTVSGTASLTVNASSTGPTAIASIGATVGNATINSNSTGFITISGANNLGAITNSGAGSGVVTFIGVIGQNVTGVIQNSATSVMVSNQANTFIGPLTIDAGVFSTSNLAAWTTVASTPPAQGIGQSAQMILNGGTFRYTGGQFSGNWAPTITVGANGGTIDTAGNGTNGFIFFGGAFAGSGTLTVINSLNTTSAWILQTAASPNFTGNIVLGNGVNTQSGIQVRGSGPNPWSNPLGTGTITINAGGLLTADNNSPAYIPNNIFMNGGSFGAQSVTTYYPGTITLLSSSFLGSPPNTSGGFNATAGTINVTGNIVGGNGANLTKDSADIAILTGNNTYSGNTIIASGGGTLQVGNATTTGSLGTGSVTNNATLIFNLSGSSAMVNAINNVTGSTMTNVGSGTTTFTGGISGAGTLTQAGAGTTVLAATNSYSGATTIQNGALQLGTLNGVGLGSLPSTTAITLGYGAAITTATAAAAGGNTTVTITAGGFTVGQQVTVAGLNPGIYDGTFTITAATATTFTYTLNAPMQTLTTLIGTASTSGLFILGDSYQPVNQTITGLLVAGNGTASAVVGGNGSVSTLTIANSTVDNYTGGLGLNGGTIQNNLALTMAGSSVLTLSGANYYTGGTNIQSGTLQLASSTAFPNATAVTLGSGLSSGIFDLNGQSITVSSLSTSGTGTANIIASSSTSSLDKLSDGHINLRRRHSKYDWGRQRHGFAQRQLRHADPDWRQYLYRRHQHLRRHIADRQRRHHGIDRRIRLRRRQPAIQPVGEFGFYGHGWHQRWRLYHSEWARHIDASWPECGIRRHCRGRRRHAAVAVGQCLHECDGNGKRRCEPVCLRPDPNFQHVDIIELDTGELRGPTTLNFAFNGTPSTAALTVTNSLTVYGTTTINISNSQAFSVSEYPLINYTGSTYSGVPNPITNAVVAQHRFAARANHR